MDILTYIYYSTVAPQANAVAGFGKRKSWQQWDSNPRPFGLDKQEHRSAWFQRLRPLGHIAIHPRAGYMIYKVMLSQISHEFICCSFLLPSTCGAHQSSHPPLILSGHNQSRKYNTVDPRFKYIVNSIGMTAFYPFYCAHEGDSQVKNISNKNHNSCSPAG